jgi:hypothetical protein
MTRMYSHAFNSHVSRILSRRNRFPIHCVPSLRFCKTRDCKPESLQRLSLFLLLRLFVFFSSKEGGSDLLFGLIYIKNELSLALTTRLAIWLYHRSPARGVKFFFVMINRSPTSPFGHLNF